MNFFSWIGKICDVAYQQSTKQMLIPSFMPMSCMRTRTNLLLLSRARTRTHKKKDIAIVSNVNSKRKFTWVLMLDIGIRPVYFYLFGRNRMGIVQILKDFGKSKKVRAERSAVLNFCTVLNICF